MILTLAHDIPEKEAPSLSNTSAGVTNCAFNVVERPRPTLEAMPDMCYITDGELSRLRAALAFLQGQLGGLEKELHDKREGETALRLQFSEIQQELFRVSDRAEKAEDDKADLIKLVDEVSLTSSVVVTDH